MIHSHNISTLLKVTSAILLAIDYFRFTSVNGEQYSKYNFPDDFLFGVATSAYQTEGAWNEDGKSESIIDNWVHTRPEMFKNNATGDVACDAYHHVDEDVELLKKIGVTTYEFAIAWTRIIPDPFSRKVNPLGVKHYDRLINKLLENGIQPMVVMYGRDLPQSLQRHGGWLNSSMTEYFLDYATVLFENYGNRVKHWLTFLQIQPICDYGYDYGYFAPLVQMPGVGGYLCTKNVLLAHAHTFRLYEANYKASQNGKLGIGTTVFVIVPANDSDTQATKRCNEFQLDRFIHPIYSQEGGWPRLMEEHIAKLSHAQGYSQSRLPKFSDDEIALIRGTYDFLGINLWSTFLCSDVKEYPERPSNISQDQMCKMSVDPSWKSTKYFGMDDVPWSVRTALKYIKDHYGGDLEIIITENGWSSDHLHNDQDRIDFYNGYLDNVLKAIYEDGANLSGFIAWSFMDNFEWQKAYTLRFGLIGVDFDNLKRTPKLSAVAYKNIIKNRYIDFDASNKTLKLEDFYK